MNIIKEVKSHFFSLLTLIQIMYNHNEYGLLLELPFKGILLTVTTRNSEMILTKMETEFEKMELKLGENPRQNEFRTKQDLYLKAFNIIVVLIKDAEKVVLTDDFGVYLKKIDDKLTILSTITMADTYGYSLNELGGYVFNLRLACFKNCFGLAETPNELNAKGKKRLYPKFCRICTDKRYKSGIIALKCKHAFHPKCLMLWFDIQGYICPICGKMLFNDWTR